MTTETSVLAVFFLVCALSTWFDFKYRMIPNGLLWPAMIVFAFLGGHYGWALFALCIGTIERHHCTLYGGDVKLIVMGALLFGGVGILAYAFSIWVMRAFIITQCKAKSLLPYAPFYLVGSILAVCFQYLIVL